VTDGAGHHPAPFSFLGRASLAARDRPRYAPADPRCTHPL